LLPSPGYGPAVSSGIAVDTSAVAVDAAVVEAAEVVDEPLVVVAAERVVVEPVVVDAPPVLVEFVLLAAHPASATTPAPAINRKAWRRPSGARHRPASAASGGSGSISSGCPSEWSVFMVSLLVV
jgi:hypothetical protein